MNKAVVILTLCLTAAGTFAEGYRVFSDTTGRSIEARIIDFNASSGQLLIERKEGAQAWVDPSVFSEQEHAYISDWVAAHQSVSKLSLRVSLDKETDKKSSKEEGVYYKMTLHNVSDQSIKGTRVLFRYFCRTYGYGKKDDKDWEKSGALSIPDIPPGERVVLKVPEIVLKETTEVRSEQVREVRANGTYTTRTERYEAKVGQDRLIGLWLKLCSKPVQGVPIVRDIFEPKGLERKVEWKNWQDDLIKPKSDK